MGISRLTAMVIQGTPVHVEPFRGDNGKYGFILSRMENDNYRMIVSSEPYAASKDIAQKDGENLVESIRKVDLATV